MVLLLDVSEGEIMLPECVYCEKGCSQARICHNCRKNYCKICVPTFIQKSCVIYSGINHEFCSIYCSSNYGRCIEGVLGQIMTVMCLVEK